MAFNHKSPQVKLTLDESFFNLMLKILSDNENVHVEQVDERAKILKDKLLKYPRVYKNDNNVNLVNVGFFPSEASDMMDQLLIYIAVNYQIELNTNYYSMLSENKENKEE